MLYGPAAEILFHHQYVSSVWTSDAEIPISWVHMLNLGDIEGIVSHPIGSLS